jgi:hypothetical protein
MHLNGPQAIQQGALTLKHQWFWNMGVGKTANACGHALLHTMHHAFTNFTVPSYTRRIYHGRWMSLDAVPHSEGVVAMPWILNSALVATWCMMYLLNAALECDPGNVPIFGGCPAIDRNACSMHQWGENKNRDFWTFR